MFIIMYAYLLIFIFLFIFLLYFIFSYVNIHEMCVGTFLHMFTSQKLEWILQAMACYNLMTIL